VPELPEVETCRRIVERTLVGDEVANVIVRLPKLLRFSEIPDLGLLVGHRIIAARRVAKILIVDFTGDLSLMIHFKLSGQLAVHSSPGERSVAGHPVPDPQGPYPHRTTHIEIKFESGAIAYFSDVRQFGWFRLMSSDDVAGALGAFKFGREGVEPGRISVDALAAALARRSIPIKQAILDQQVVAGVGNIYADEALHRARIHPSQPAKTLTRADIEALHDAIAWSLERGIELGGAKIVHHKAFPIDGFPAVHARQGEQCNRCGEAIVKTRVGGRGTYLCLRCQTLVDEEIAS
jgi:formamidopyrimidine-DNA glycosylase